MADNDITPQSPLSNEDLGRAIDNAWSDALGVQHRIRFLMENLEHGLSEDRATRMRDDLVTLNFTSDSIDATLWLVRETWRESVGLTERLNSLINGLPPRLDADSAKAA